MEPLSGRAEQQYAALVRAADGLVIGLDFDGTLAPIVADPESAVIHAEGRGVLVGLAEQVRAIAVVTGRPARQVVDLGDFDAVGDELTSRGRDLIVLGQYGHERWSASQRRIVSPPPPAGLSSLLAELPRLLAGADAADAWVEEKVLAVAVHTRRMAEPRAAFERLLPVLVEAAGRHGLQVEPGRSVIEIRDASTHKGVAVETLAAELSADALVFIGDDLGDVQAFEATRAWGERTGSPTLLVCSGSPEEEALVSLSDAVVPGPDGVMAFLTQLTRDIRASRL